MFMILMKGWGEECCSYTIGCNKNFKTLLAKDRPSAYLEIEQILGEYSDDRIEEIELLEVSDKWKFNVSSYYTKKKEEYRKEEEKKKEEKERKLYELLKSKYEKGKGDA